MPEAKAADDEANARADRREVLAVDRQEAADEPRPRQEQAAFPHVWREQVATADKSDKSATAARVEFIASNLGCKMDLDHGARQSAQTFSESSDEGFRITIVRQDARASKIRSAAALPPIDDWEAKPSTPAPISLKIINRWSRQVMERYQGIWSARRVRDEFNERRTVTA